MKWARPANGATCRHSKRPSDIVVNPTFALSQCLGGADADVVVDRTLWDYKASRQQSVLRREDIWQIVGYALAHTDNAFQLETLDSPRCAAGYDTPGRSENWSPT